MNRQDIESKLLQANEDRDEITALIDRLTADLSLRVNEISRLTGSYYAESDELRRASNKLTEIDGQIYTLTKLRDTYRGSS